MKFLASLAGNRVVWIVASLAACLARAVTGHAAPLLRLSFTIPPFDSCLAYTLPCGRVCLHHLVVPGWLVALHEATKCHYPILEPPYLHHFHHLVPSRNRSDLNDSPA